jgi:hypothetical protein
MGNGIDVAIIVVDFEFGKGRNDKRFVLITL